MARTAFLRLHAQTLAILIVAIRVLAADDTATIGLAASDDGCLVHEVQSAFQQGRTQIRVLMPKNLAPSERYPTVYVLPVEAGRMTRYGDGLAEVKKLDLHNKHRAIFVAPTFSALPWYADHPTDPAIRQESYLLEVVLPFVEKTYPVRASRDGRLLVGFSKSGWGAWSLLLRHPDIFGKAAAWDAPLAMERLGQFGTTPIFGSQENFEQYRIHNLLPARASSLRSQKRLILTGYGNFRIHHEQTHRQLEELKAPHDYRDGPERKHDWHSGWLAETVELLFLDR
jgi:S-formylglutathione hydrolase FrmB